MATNTSILGLTKPAYTDDADVAVINSNSDLIDAEAGRTRANFAAEYSTSSAYAVGAFCTHAGILYQCNTAIGSGGEAWTSGHWTQISAGDAIVANNQAIAKHALGSKTTESDFDAAIITAIGNATTSVPYWISITHSFSGTKFAWAVYEGVILKGAGTSTMAAIVLTSGTDFVYGSYNGTSITWVNQTKQSVIMSQSITVTTGAGGGVQLSNFTNYDPSTDTPLYVVIATTNADVYAVLSETSAGKPTWFTAKNASGNVTSTSVSATLFWSRSV